MSVWTFFIITFGCKVNQYESQALREAWRTLGGREAASAAGADVILVNSCAVTAKAERDARNALYRIRREAPAARRLLTGCSARLAGEPLLNTEFLHALVAQEHKSTLLQGPWTKLPAPGSPSAFPSFPPFSISGFERARPVLKVQDGCSHRCSYCIVPLTRGPARSRSPLDVLAEAEKLLEAGFRELVLSGINLSQYGRDLPGKPAFPTLLRLLEDRLAPRWAGRARLRISSLEPSQLDAHELELPAQSRLLCPHLHLSLQSGSPEVLRRMGRGHTKLERLVSRLEQLRRTLPVIGLGADLLTGFPGESEEQFHASLDIIKTLQLSYAHVFPYSRRPGTPAAELPEQIPQPEKLRRARLLRETAAAQQADFLQRLSALPLLHLHLDGASSRGIDEHYAPCRLVHTPPQETRELLPVRPLRVENGALLVESL